MKLQSFRYAHTGLGLGLGLGLVFQGLFMNPADQVFLWAVVPFGYMYEVTPEFDSVYH